MQQFKELIDDIDIEYIKMPNKLECLIIGKTLYLNSNFSLNPHLTKSFNSSKNFNIYSLLPINYIKEAIKFYDCNSIEKLSNFFHLPIHHIFLTIYFYNSKNKISNSFNIIFNDY